MSKHLKNVNGWAPKNWCFWTVVLEKILESPLDCKEIQPVHPKGISPEYSLEGLMLKLHFGHQMWRTDSFEKTLMLGKIEGKGDHRGWDGWMASLTQWTWIWVNSESWWWTGRPGMLQSIGSQRVGHDWETELNCKYHIFFWHLLLKFHFHVWLPHSDLSKLTLPRLGVPST